MLVQALVSRPTHPRLDLFSAFHFLCIANRKRRRRSRRGEIFDEEKEKVEGSRGRRNCREDLRSFIAENRIDFFGLKFGMEEIKRQRFSVRWKHEVGIWELNIYSWLLQLIRSSCNLLLFASTIILQLFDYFEVNFIINFK